MKQFNRIFTENRFTLILTIILFGLISCTYSKEKNKTEVKAPSVTIQEAAFFGNIEAIESHIAYKSDLNEKDAYGSTPLHIAIMFGRIEAAKLLIEAGADLSAQSADGSSPLHAASFFCHTEVVQALLEKEVDITAKNLYGFTALETLSTPYEDVKGIYEQFGKDLGPLGLKLDYERIEETRPVIAKMIEESSN